MSDNENRVYEEGKFSVSLNGERLSFLFYRESVLTMCSIRVRGRDDCLPGWAVRSRDDSQDDEVGRRVALRRAIARRHFDKLQRRVIWEGYFTRSNRPGGGKKGGIDGCF